MLENLEKKAREYSETKGKYGTLRDILERTMIGSEAYLKDKTGLGVKKDIIYKNLDLEVVLKSVWYDGLTVADTPTQLTSIKDFVIHVNLKEKMSGICEEVEVPPLKDLKSEAEITEAKSVIANLTSLAMLLP